MKKRRTTRNTKNYSGLSSGDKLRHARSEQIKIELTNLFNNLCGLKAADIFANEVCTDADLLFAKDIAEQYNHEGDETI